MVTGLGFGIGLRDRLDGAQVAVGDRLTFGVVGLLEDGDGLFVALGSAVVVAEFLVVGTEIYQKFAKSRTIAKFEEEFSGFFVGADSFEVAAGDFVDDTEILQGLGFEERVLQGLGEGEEGFEGGDGFWVLFAAQVSLTRLEEGGGLLGELLGGLGGLTDCGRHC